MPGKRSKVTGRSCQYVLVSIVRGEGCAFENEDIIEGYQGAVPAGTTPFLIAYSLELRQTSQIVFQTVLSS